MGLLGAVVRRLLAGITLVCRTTSPVVPRGQLRRRGESCRSILNAEGAASWVERCREGLLSGSVARQDKAAGTMSRQANRGTESKKMVTGACDLGGWGGMEVFWGRGQPRAQVSTGKAPSASPGREWFRWREGRGSLVTGGERGLALGASRVRVRLQGRWRGSETSSPAT